MTSIPLTLCNTSAAQSPIKSPKIIRPSFDRKRLAMKFKKPTSILSSKLVNTDTNAVSYLPKKITSTSLDDLEILIILNRFVFLLFLLFIILVNALCLYILPYLVKVPLIIDDFV